MRIGAKGKPFYRVVVKEKRSKRDGKYLENLGTYNPMLDPAEVDLKHDRIQYWIGVGAQPTETVTSLIKNNPVMTDEEKAAAQQARAEKRAADEKAKADAKKAEADRIAAEEAERAAAEKAEADAAAAQAAAELAAIETPVQESEQANDPNAAPAADGHEFPEAGAVAEAEGGAIDEPKA
jgi:small subunit ribosomal protein S16